MMLANAEEIRDRARGEGADREAANAEKCLRGKQVTIGAEYTSYRIPREEPASAPDARVCG